MKKLSVVLFILSLFLAMPSWGQVEVGILGGATFPDLSIDPDDPDVSYDTRTGFTAGGILVINITRAFALQLEPSYTQKGARADGVEREGFGVQKANVRLSYIDVPVLLKFSMGNTSVNPYLLAGPSISFLLSSKLDFDNEEITTEDLKNITRDIDFGVNFGAGVSLALGNNQLFFEGQYNLGLIKIDEVESLSFKTRGLQFKTGVAFPL